MCGSSLLRDEAAGEVRRAITLVTSDLKGSTALGERLDPEALREVLNRYFDVMRAVFESHGGTIEKIIGDAIVAVFGLPFRHDDDPLRALEAAAESQRALATLNDELDHDYGVRLVVRTGVATGEVTFGAAEAGQHVLLGPPVEVSTVMEQNSPSQEVLVHESTRDLVGDAAEFEAVEPVSPKGADEKLTAFRLVSVRDRTGEDEEIVPDAAPGMRICPSCGEQSPDRMRFCTVCGASLTQAVARESRRTVTIVFAMPKVHSLTGEVAGPDTMRDVMSRYFDGMREALERHGGTVEKFIGDAVMAVFGLPVRHEDDAVRAIRAAADMQTALDALNPGFRTNSGLELSNHIGVNSGEVIAGDASTAQRMVTGDAVNTAARLEQAAAGGEVVLGDLTYRLARDKIEVEFMAPLELKGKAKPVPAYRLVRISTESSMGRSHGTPFVGRDTEMAWLSASLEDAISNRRARLATVVGDAGVGKSRLIKEFANAATERARLVRGRCLAYGDGITFWPLAEVVREAAGITNEDTPRIATRRIDRLMEQGGAEDREAVVERIAAAINLSPAQFPVAELMWGGRRFLETIAAERPLVMLVDDLHWAEPTFLDFLDHLLETVEGASLLVLGSARHEIAERHAEWSTGHESMLIKLAPLSEADAGRIVEELLGSLETSVRERIAIAAEGNPLYVEQIVSMLVETGAIQRGLEGWVARAGSAQLEIPPTVQALVAARLDALKSEERAVVDPASVIGLSFPLDAVSELVDEPVRARLGADLEALTGKQLVRRLPEGDVIYRFGHQIIRDTAYGSLLKRNRAALHERFVNWAERVNADRGRELEFEEILGYHLEQAYQFRTSLGVMDAHAQEVGERAAVKLSSAGRRALARGDLPAAVGLLRRSVALLPRESATRIEVIVDLADGLGQQGLFDEAAAVLREGEAVAVELDDDRLRTRVRLLQVMIDIFGPGGSGRAAAGGVSAALDIAREAVGVLEAHGDHAGVARAWRLILLLRVMLGSYAQVSDVADQLIRHANLAGDRRLASRSAPLISFTLVRGATRVADAMASIRELKDATAGDRKTEAVLLGSLAQLEAMSGNFDQARAYYREGQTILAELGAGIDAHTTSIDSARVEILAGDPAAAERELRRDHDALEALGETYFRSFIDGMLAHVLITTGRLEEANSFATSAEELSEADDKLSQVLWMTARARLLASQGQPAAESIARNAVNEARTTADVELLADALTDLGGVLSNLGSAGDATNMWSEALELYERKGDQASAAMVQRRLKPGLAPRSALLEPSLEP
jgi:Predicted ATPase